MDSGCLLMGSRSSFYSFTLTCLDGDSEGLGQRNLARGGRDANSGFCVKQSRQRLKDMEAAGLERGRPSSQPSKV